MTQITPPSAQTTIFDIPFDPCPECGFKGPHYCMGKQPFSSSLAKLNTEPESVTETIQRAQDNAGDEWSTQAATIVRNLCTTRSEFNLDDVAERVPPTEEKRALGQVMRNAVKQGLCTIVRYEKSKRKSRHYGTIAVYQSLLFGR